MRANFLGQAAGGDSLGFLPRTHNM